MAPNPARKVLVAGGGVGALETTLALQSLAPGRFDIEMLAPERHFTHRPLALGADFRRATPPRVELAAIARDRGFKLTRDALESVDAAAHEVTTQDGARIPYDVLVLALGTRPIAAVDGALPFRGSQDVAAVADALEAIGSGPSRVAYVARSASTWTVPLYQLALHTVAWAEDRGLAVEVLLATAELEPLEAFGPAASRRIADLLEQTGVRHMPGAIVDRVKDGRLHIKSERSIPVDVAVALPFLAGPAVSGVPHDFVGFTPVDETGRVYGVEDVYAVGDMTDRPVRQGGLAAQQADVAAGAIAAAAGAPVQVEAYRPVLRATLLSSRAPRHLRNPPAEDDPAGPDAGLEAGWWPPQRIAALHLAPYLATHGGLEAVH